MPAPSPAHRPWRTWAILALGALGLANMAADLTGCAPLKGLATATAASPLPKVFSDVRGLETFASDFAFEIEAPGEAPRRVSITPELYARLAGPYNRRNVYGAALAYAPRLPEALWQSVFCFALRPGGPLREELGLPADPAARIRVTVRTHTRGRDDAWTLDPLCLR